MRVVLMHLINHTLSIREFVADELHGVPSVVGAPVLPVLHDTVERHT